jgi:ribosomal protein S18 acetylase RimI-like enzyme
MMLVVRPATPDDASAIATIHVRSWQTAYQGFVPEAFLRSLSIEARADRWRTILEEATAGTFVAEERPATVGWITVGRSRDADAGPSTGELWAIYVAPEHWGRGAGRLLWDGGRSHLAAAGYADVTLWVLKDNRRARRFYEAAGFAPDAGQEKMIELGGARIPEIRLRRSPILDALA